MSKVTLLEPGGALPQGIWQTISTNAAEYLISRSSIHLLRSTAQVLTVTEEKGSTAGGVGFLGLFQHHSVAPN